MHTSRSAALRGNLWSLSNEKTCPKASAEMANKSRPLSQTAVQFYLRMRSYFGPLVLPKLGSVSMTWFSFGLQKNAIEYLVGVYSAFASTA